MALLCISFFKIISKHAWTVLSAWNYQRWEGSIVMSYLNDILWIQKKKKKTLGVKIPKT